jgi:hypothetical protein
MNVGVGTVAPQFLSWEYLFQIFGLVSLLCIWGTTYIIYIRLVVVTPRRKHLNPVAKFLVSVPRALKEKTNALQAGPPR